MSFENLSSTDAYASTTSISTLLYDLTEKTIINNDKEELILATDATNTEPPTIAYEYSKNLAMFLSIYFIPVITVFGSVGNILSVMVFLRTKLKKLSSSYYLAALAIFDTGFLWCYQLEWLGFVQIDIYKWNGFCQIFTWLSNVCSVLSVWLVVAFTVERFVAVHYPLRRKSLCTVQRARCVIFYLILFHGICCSPLFYLAVSLTALKPQTMEPEIQCSMDQSLKKFMAYYNYYDFFVAFLIPLTLIITLNAVTAFAVWKPSRIDRTAKNYNRDRNVSFRGSSNRKHPQNDFRQSAAEMQIFNRSIKTRTGKTLNGHQNAGQSYAHQKRISMSTQMKATQMLLVISTAFVILNLPSYVIRVWIFIVSANNTYHWYIILQHFAQTLYLCNFGINFVLYCMSGQNFRKELMGLFKRRVQSRVQVGTHISEFKNTW